MIDDTNTTTIDVDSIENEKLDDEMRDTISDAVSLVETYLDDKDGIPSKSPVGPEMPVHREDCHFSHDEENTLFDAWQMLRYCGLSDTELKVLTRVIEEDTIYDKNTLERYYDGVVLE